MAFAGCLTLGRPVLGALGSDQAPASQPAGQAAAKDDAKAESDEAAPAEDDPRAQKAVEAQQRREDTATRERLRKMLGDLDPAMFNSLIGAEIDIEVVGGQVIIQGPEEAVKKLEVLIKMIDQAKPRKAVEVVTVQKRDANEIAKSLQPELRRVLMQPNQAPDDELSIAAISPNLILVSAIPDQIDFVVDLIHQVDETEDPLGKIEQITFPLKNRRAADVAEQLKKTLKEFNAGRGKTGAKGETQVIANTANNSIMVIAPESEREKLQALVDTLDVAPAKGWGEVKLTVFPLLHSKASELTEVITKLLAAQGAQGAGDRKAAEELIKRLIISKALPSGEILELPPIDLEKPTKVLADAGTNSLIVATVEENVGPMGELVRLLDGVPLGADADLRIFPLRFADAEAVSETLKKMFDDGKKLPEDPDGSGQGSVPTGDTGRALVHNVGIASDARTNTLIVSGRAEQLKLVESVVNELDRPANTLKFPLRMLPMQFTDAAHVAKLLTDLFDKRMESLEATGADRFARERERVFMSLDLAGNALIVSASPDNLEEIEKFVKQLDAKPGRRYDSIRIVRCERLSATDIKEKIDELWKRKSDLRSDRELLADTPILAVDERSNSLLIASSVEDFEEIKGLVEALEKQTRVDDLQLYQLQFADAAALADMLEKLFQDMEGQSESFKAPTVLPDPRSNALVVAGGRESLERAAEVIKRLDIKAGPTTAVFKVYPLQYGSSGKLAKRMQELFDSRAEGDESKRTPTVILPDESSNSLVVSASMDDQDIVVDLLGLLDRPSNLSRQFEIFPLKMAKAAKVAESLENVFKTEGEGSGGRADAISTVADERTNSIIVWASPAEMSNIRDVIARLDTSEPTSEMMVKVIQLKQALAEDFATLLEETLIGEGGGEGDDQRAVIVSFLDKDDKGREVTRRLIRQDIRIKPDPRTNSLMVMAPSDSMVMLEAMIRDFDRIRPVTSEIRLFTLINSDAKTMVERLDELFAPKEGGGEGETQTQLVFGELVEGLDLATVGQELRFAADTRTNTLIAAGSPVYLTMVEDLVTYLDAQEAEDRVVEVINAKYRPATDLATAVKGFIEQELDVLGDSEDEESKLRRQERQVSIEAIGNEEEGSSSLVLGTSRRAYQRTMDMVDMLDRPEPQVMITVLIAEVGLNDRSELGVEIAGQDLAFSESAVVGPNGIIQGGDFDYVLGTTLGAIGTGTGFNFTLNGEDLNFLFHALQSNNRFEVLSRPILMVRNGEEGNITIADQVPVVESTQLNDTGQTQTVVGREDVGIILTATPHISPDGYVTIALKQEISNISNENVDITEGVRSPIFSTREVTTNVTVRDGETVIIGGLIQTRESLGENKFPILGDLPIIGPLLRSTNTTRTKNELLVVLTVDILRTDEDVKNMSLTQRDKYGLPDSILKSPLMEKLRITPAQSLGPVPAGPSLNEPTPENQYGPKPSTYGPAVPPSNTTRATGGVYGPFVSKETAVAHP